MAHEGERLIDDDTTVRVRQAAQRLIFECLDPGEGDLESLNVELAQLTAGIDPDEIDTGSDEFRAGAELALSAAMGTLMATKPGKVTYQFLKYRKNAALFAKVASAPYITESQIPAIDPILNAIGPMHARSLYQLGLIEPAINEESNEKAWQISPGGRQTYLRMLPQLAEIVGIDDTLEGLRGILTAMRPQKPQL